MDTDSVRDTPIASSTNAFSRPSLPHVHRWPSSPKKPGGGAGIFTKDTPPNKEAHKPKYIYRSPEGQRLIANASNPADIGELVLDRIHKSPLLGDKDPHRLQYYIAGHSDAIVRMDAPYPDYDKPRHHLSYNSEKVRISSCSPREQNIYAFTGGAQMNSAHISASTSRPFPSILGKYRGIVGEMRPAAPRIANRY